jgi:hypothetical protein
VIFMILADLKAALLTVTSKVYHFDATGATGNYIVWAEDGQANSVWADGRMKEQTITGTIDYYTKTEYDVNFSTIQAALGVIGISYRLNSIQYEELTKYIHTEWVFEIG